MADGGSLLIFFPSLRKPRKDTLDQHLAKADDPQWWRNVYDDVNDEELRLTDDELKLLRRLRAGKFDPGYDPVSTVLLSRSLWNLFRDAVMSCPCDRHAVLLQSLARVWRRDSVQNRAQRGIEPISATHVHNTPTSVNLFALMSQKWLIDTPISADPFALISRRKLAHVPISIDSFALALQERSIDTL